MLNLRGFGLLLRFVSPNSCLGFVSANCSSARKKREKIEKVRVRERARKLLLAVRSRCSNSFRQQKPEAALLISFFFYIFFISFSIFFYSFLFL